MSESVALRAHRRTVHFRELVEEALIGIYVSTPDGQLQFCNAAFARLLGFATVDEAVGCRLETLYAVAGDRDRFVERVRTARHLEPHRTRLRRRDGRFIDVLESVVGGFDAVGELVELRGQVVDVTANVAMESALHEREDQFRAVFNDAADAILVLDDSRRVMDANAAAEALFAIAAGDLGRRTLDNLLDGTAEIDDLWNELLALGEVKREHRLPRGQTARMIECSYRARVRAGRHLCIGRDITERRMLEWRLQQSEKIETVGRLAGGIAHDFNNLLTAILGYSELMQARGGLDHQGRADLDEIRKAGERAAALTRQLLAFSRKQVLVAKDVDLNAVVEGLQQMLGRVIREDIALVVKPAAEPAIVCIDPNQFEQVVTNLVVNARDAISEGGRIELSLAQEELASGMVDGVPAGRYVRVRVSDTGSGMSPEVRAHLFEPFFTTKELGRGTGLGLASVYGIVRQSNGYITVESTPNAGTDIIMYFPSSDRQPQPAEERPALAPGTTATILLVEDEDAVRVIVSAVLKRSGFNVLEASTPRSACEIFAGHRDRIDLLLTDVVMPEINGPALAQRFVAERPELRVLFISGYANVAVSAFDSDNPNTGFLSKPFQASALVTAVQEILARPRPS